MTHVDFYILAAQSQQEQWQFACRLVEKAVLREHQVLVQVDDAAQAEAFDELLWCFRDDAFVPHALLFNKELSDKELSDKERTAAQVSIGWQTDPGHQHDLIINLSQQLPSFFSRFRRMMEVVVQQDDVLDYTRKHYRFLQDRGYPIKHTDMRMR